MLRIEFVFFDAGGGHRSAAISLESAIKSQNRPWDVRLMNLQEQLDPLDIVKSLTGLRVQDVYNTMLQRGWTLGSAPLMRVLQMAIRFQHKKTVRQLETYWLENQPDLVVSLVPHFNRALQQSYQNVFPGRPFVTLLTDFADYPPHFWIERQEQYLICGTEKAATQARGAGHSADHVFRTSGMVVHPRFYEDRTIEPHAERKKLGLDPECPTALVLFGGHGAKAMLDIVTHLGEARLGIQLILICGRNEPLAQALRSLRSPIRIHVEGFTKEVPYFMRLADFFIGKPGPGSIAEALLMGLPVIVASNAWTLPQERYNAVWVQENETGLVVRSYREIAEAARTMLTPEIMARFRKNVAAHRNRAVFEVPELLDRLLQQQGKQ